MHATLLEYQAYMELIASDSSALLSLLIQHVSTQTYSTVLLEGIHDLSQSFDANSISQNPSIFCHPLRCASVWGDQSRTF